MMCNSLNRLIGVQPNNFMFITLFTSYFLSLRLNKFQQDGLVKPVSPSVLILSKKVGLNFSSEFSHKTRLISSLFKHFSFSSLTKILSFFNATDNWSNPSEFLPFDKQELAISPFNNCRNRAPEFSIVILLSKNRANNFLNRN